MGGSISPKHKISECVVRDQGPDTRVVSSLFNRGITHAAFLRNLLESPRNTFGGDCPPSPLPTSRNDWGGYLYTNAALPASGEDCLNKVIKPTAFARVPTLHRIPFLKVAHVSFIYGQNDWMDPTGGIDVYGVKNNSAMVIALGRKHALPSQAPVPYQHEVLETGSSLFFSQPRWERKEEKNSCTGAGQSSRHEKQGTPSMEG